MVFTGTTSADQRRLVLAISEVCAERCDARDTRLRGGLCKLRPPFARFVCPMVSVNGAKRVRNVAVPIGEGRRPTAIG